MTATILVIEDQSDLRMLLRVVLTRAGHQLLEAVDGRSGLRALHQHHPDLVLLDVGLPDLDGWQVLERIRELSDVPVLMLTARSLEADKVRGLDAGADDYMTKPFGTAELVSRVNAGLRRHGSQRPEQVDVFTDGQLTVDFVHHRVTVDGHEVVLTPLEHRLLVALVRHPDQMLSPEDLLTHAWQDPTGVGPDRVKFVVARLRRKLGNTDPASSPIVSVRGFGYRYRSATR
jgi:DNA-binding response OmpR family regulator